MIIVVLGGGIDLKGNLPSHVIQRLDQAIKLHKTYPHSRIILSGKYSFLWTDPKPTLTEAESMASYLIKEGINKRAIVLEKRSKDTIGNAYYLKKNVFMPMGEKEAIIITSAFHENRVHYIFQKIFGGMYKFTYIGLKEHLPKEEEKKIIERQKELLLKTKDLLSSMKDGHHDYLKNKLYKIKYYREKRPAWVTNFVSKGT